MGVMGGRNLGVATGKIEVDVAALTQAAAQAKRAGQEMERALRGAGNEAVKAESRMKRFGRSLRNLKGELTAVALAGGALSVIGINTAASIEEAEIKLKGLTGSQVEAVKLMKQLRVEAKAAALPFGDVLQMSTMLLPSLEGNTAELGKWFDLVKRVSVLNPQEGLRGAAFSVREAMTTGGTDLVSLSERFNINRAKIREALQETGGDFAKALDMVLNKMGITTEVAEEMGGTFRRSLGMAKDSFQQLLGAGFAPFLDTLTDVLQGTAKWLDTLRETSPGIATLISGLAGITAIAAPALLIINQLVIAFKALGLARLGAMAFGAASSPIGLAAMIIGGVGIGGGIGLARGIGKVTGNKQMQQTNFGDVKDAFAALPGLIAEGLRPITDPGSIVGQLLFSQVTDVDRGFTTKGGGTSVAGREFWDDLWKNNIGADTGGDGGRSFGPKQVGVMVKWQEDIVKIEEDAARDRLDTTEKFGRQRADTIRDFGRSMTRESEDWARSTARAFSDLQKGIGDVQEDAARREQLAQEDFDDKMVNLREDHSKKLGEIESRAAEQREDAIAGHRDKIRKAASRLDARAIIEENQRFGRQMKKINRDEKKKTTDTNKQFEERTEQETKAHEKRLERAREADERRIDDMRETFEEQRRVAEEDRALRLDRLREDHNDQLTEQAEAHERRMTQITEQENTEKEERNRLFEEQLAAQGIKTAAFEEAEKEREKIAIETFDAFWDHMLNRMSGGFVFADAPDPGDTHRAPSDPTSPTPFAKGGPVSGTTRALLHSGEYVLNPSVAESLRAMLGNFSQPELVTAVAGGTAGGNRNTSVRIAPGAIIVNESQRPGMTAREVEGAMLSVIRRIA